MIATHALSAGEWLGLFLHFMMLSMLAIGGAITTAPEMHRYVVAQHGWLTDAQFTTSIAIAQAAPGPNLLFVAAIGWNVAGFAGALATMLGILIPSTTVALAATRWGAQRRESRGVRTFIAGMAPLTIGLVLSTGWVLAEPSRHSLGAIALVVIATLVTWRSRLSPVWMVALGAVAGALGLA